MVDKFASPLLLHVDGSGIRIYLKLVILACSCRAFASVAWPIGIQLVMYVYFSVSIELFDTNVEPLTSHSYIVTGV